MPTSWSSAPRAATISVAAGRSEMMRGAATPASVVTPDREDDEGGEQQREPRHVPARVLRHTVVDDAEAGEHLTEQPPDDALRDSRREPPLLGDGTVPEAHVGDLHERVQPR